MGGVLHLRADQQRAAFSLSTDGSQFRDEQSAGLLEHVPRVIGHGPDGVDRDRQGSVTVADIENADLIIVAGQNPGTNHPRMLTVLEKAKANGARIIAVNPLPEAGLIRFKDPQTVRGIAGRGVPIADEFVQIRLGGDMALFRGLARLLLEADDRAPGTVLDHDFIATHCHGFDDYAAAARALDLATVVEATGVDRTQLQRVAAMLAAPAHGGVLGDGADPAHHAVATIAEATNVLLLRGMIGKPGAGCARSAGTPTCKAIGPWASGSRPRKASSRRLPPGSVSMSRAGTAMTPSTRSGPCATAGRRCSWAWAATSPRLHRTPP